MPPGAEPLLLELFLFNQFLSNAGLLFPLPLLLLLLSGFPFPPGFYFLSLTLSLSLSLPLGMGQHCPQGPRNVCRPFGRRAEESVPYTVYDPGCSQVEQSGSTGKHMSSGRREFNSDI